jgi:hypothetical protein
MLEEKCARYRSDPLSLIDMGTCLPAYNSPTVPFPHTPQPAHSSGSDCLWLFAQPFAGTWGAWFEHKAPHLVEGAKHLKMLILTRHAALATLTPRTVRSAQSREYAAF